MTSVEEIKQKIDIVDLVSSYVDLKKAGRNYRGLCPFHGEKSPSFMVSPELQIFKCFGCGEAGDLFTFHQKIEGVDFGQTLEALAERAGVKLEKQIHDPNKEKRKVLFAINSLAVEYYKYILTKHKVGKKALKYLKDSRKLSDKTIEEFSLGYAPDSWDSLFGFLTKKKYTPEQILSAGLIVPGNRGGFIDKFRGRIVFPFTGIDGKSVGFTGRALGDEQPKYLNSPETDVFHKSTFLYGLDKAKIAVKKEGAVFVEGQMDLIAAHQAGIENVVAASGTSLTVGQLKVLSRYTQDVTFAFDTDLAGDNAVHRSIELAESQGMNVKVVIIPKEYKDLDELIKSDPKEAKEVLKNSVPIFDFFLISVLRKFDITNSIQKRKAMDELVPLFNKISDPVVKDHYVKRIAGDLDVSESVVADLLSKRPVEKPRFEREADTQKDLEVTRRTPEEYILALLLKAPLEISQSALHKLAQKDFSEERLVEIFTELKSQMKDRKRKLDIQAFNKKLPESLQPLLDELFLWDLEYVLETEAVLEKELSGTIDKIKRATAKKELKELRDKIRQAEAIKDKKGLAELTREFKELSEKLI